MSNKTEDNDGYNFTYQVEDTSTPSLQADPIVAVYMVRTEPLEFKDISITSDFGWSRIIQQNKYSEDIRNLLNQTMGWLAGINDYPEELKSIVGDILDDVDSEDDNERHKIIERTTVRVLLWVLGEYNETDGR